MRLFIALHLAPETLAEVSAIQSELRSVDDRRQVRWVDPRSIHVSLQFLGEVDPGQEGEIEEALGGAFAGRPACRLALAGAGAFPSLKRARVLWLGLVEEGDALGPLQAAVSAATEPLGWKPEERAFQPHLTLGRVREGPGGRPQTLVPEFLRAIERVVPPQGGARLHDRVALVQSHLSPAGARYEDLRTWKLEV